MDALNTTYEDMNIVSPSAPIAQSAIVTEVVPGEVADAQILGVQSRELMAPGHIYNPRTGTGIEWMPSNSHTAERGKARLWSRQWSGQPVLLAEGTHDTDSAWEYWYRLEFARSFPQVTHWWFGDAWTGQLSIWRPDVVEHDPESAALMLTGWLRFGTADMPALPWTVVLTSPPRVNIPLPLMATNLANLPLQLLVADKVMEVLDKLTEQAIYAEELARDGGPDLELFVTSLVRREDLQRAFPCDFGPWRLDKLPSLTAREALCRVQGLEAATSSVAA